MTRDNLHVGFAPIQLLCSYADGHTDSAGNFVTREVAEKTRVFLAKLFPENSYDITEETPVLPAFKGKL